MGEAVSSKKKEKKKHVDHVESSIFIAPGTVRSSDDLEDDSGDHRVLSRYFITVSSPEGPAGERGSLCCPFLRGGRAGADSRGNLVRMFIQIHTEFIWQVGHLPESGAQIHPQRYTWVPPVDLTFTRPADKQLNRKIGSLPSLLTPSIPEWELAVSREMAGP